MSSYHSSAGTQCSTPCQKMANLQSDLMEGVCSNQPEELKLKKFVILPQQKRHSGHSRLSQPSTSLFSGVVMGLPLATHAVGFTAAEDIPNYSLPNFTRRGGLKLTSHWHFGAP
ncbi:CMRF35-like molecule 1 [Platysternon megacephalum]|uniref:CMRF35-like molecule 1 n=1 Tax=Platysternon megacephalum TaxID=55544 RepID=A0A4D9E3L1_9SAUR|nr:CMRF35-like molecule 1 [Platysternon megacephalum]